MRRLRLVSGTLIVLSILIVLGLGGWTAIVHRDYGLALAELEALGAYPTLEEAPLATSREGLHLVARLDRLRETIAERAPADCSPRGAGERGCGEALDEIERLLRSKEALRLRAGGERIYFEEGLRLGEDRTCVNLLLRRAWTAARQDMLGKACCHIGSALMYLQLIESRTLIDLLVDLSLRSIVEAELEAMVEEEKVDARNLARLLREEWAQPGPRETRRALRKETAIFLREVVDVEGSRSLFRYLLTPAEKKQMLETLRYHGALHAWLEGTSPMPASEQDPGTAIGLRSVQESLEELEARRGALLAKLDNLPARPAPGPK